MFAFNIGIVVYTPCPDVSGAKWLAWQRVNRGQISPLQRNTGDSLDYYVTVVNLHYVPELARAVLASARQ